jgi:hypothetical protein
VDESYGLGGLEVADLITSPGLCFVQGSVGFAQKLVGLDWAPSGRTGHAKAGGDTNVG